MECSEDQILTGAVALWKVQRSKTVHELWIRAVHKLWLCEKLK